MTLFRCSQGWRGHIRSLCIIGRPIHTHTHAHTRTRTHRPCPAIVCVHSRARFSDSEVDFTGGREGMEDVGPPPWAGRGNSTGHPSGQLWRPAWSLSTILAKVGWSSLVVCMNTVQYYMKGGDLCWFLYGICSDSSIQLTRTLISHRWQLINGVKATPKALKAALCEMRLMSIVDKYFEGV